MKSKTSDKLLDVFLEDSDMKYYSQRIKLEERRVAQLLSDIKDFIQNPQYTKEVKESFKRGAPPEFAASPTKEDLEDFRSSYMTSFQQLSRQTPKQVPMAWKMLGRDITNKVAEIIDIRNKTIPSLKEKFDARRVQLEKGIKVNKMLAQNASSIALLRSTKVHPVWSVVASKLR